MKFMVLMIPKVYRDNKEMPKDWTPLEESFERMDRYNNELIKAGILKGDGLGLHPLTQGARVSFANGKATVTDGPFVEAKEVLGGFWIWEAASKEEAVTWAQRCPAEEGDILEIRQIHTEKDIQDMIDAQKKNADVAKK